MKDDPQTRSAQSNRVGSLWMILSMAAFAIEDYFIKAASVQMPIGQILLIFGLGGAACFAAITLMSGDKLWHPDVLSRPMRYRFIYEITGRLFYFLAITLIPLSLATVILQATPIFVIAGAAIFFSEKVSAFRWLCVATGFIGVLIILQPGLEGFSPHTILAVIGVFGFAGRDLASRAASKNLTTSMLGFYGFVSVAIAGVCYIIWDSTKFTAPNSATLSFISCAVLFGIAAYFSLMKAMRTGEVSAVTPFRYSRLLFGVLIGIVFLGESLSLATLIGASLIVVSGLLAQFSNR